MESERLQLHKSLVDDIIKGMEQVEQLKVSSRQRMLTSYKEALFILTGRDPHPRGQCHPVISSSSHSDPPGSSSLKRKFREDMCLEIRTFGQECDDGYKWRKYGQRGILGSKFPRSYYRCAEKFERGCAATKQVQRSSIDPTKFEVTYRGKHSCLAGMGEAIGQVLRKEDAVAGHELKNIVWESREDILGEVVEHVREKMDEFGAEDLLSRVSHGSPIQANRLGTGPWSTDPEPLTGGYRSESAQEMFLDGPVTVQDFETVKPAVNRHF